MTDPRPILHIANFADRVGGGEESLLALIRRINRQRFAPYLIVPAEGEVSAAAREAGIPVAILPLPPVRPWAMAATLRALLRLRALIADWAIELVHAHGSRGALYANIAALRLQVQVIWHVRIVDRDPLLDPLLLLRSTRIIAISNAVKARFEGSRFSWKARVIYNGVDSDHWKPADRSGSPNKRPVVLLAGRFMPEKGQAMLLEAAPAVLQRFRTVRFILMGEDSNGERARLQMLARRLGIDAAVEIRERMSDPRPVFHDADVIVLPSRSEGFGRVLMEAACLARPVIATRVGGIPEVVVDGETGLLIPPDNPRALADALIKLLGDPALRVLLGAAARERALTCFTVRRHVDDVEKMYTELLTACCVSSVSPSLHSTSLSVIIPAFNEALRIGETIRRIDHFLAEQGWTAEILVIDDGSSDSTARIVEDEAHHVTSCYVRLAVNPRNNGKGYSVRRGMRLAAGRLLLISDADLSTPIEEVLALRAAIDRGACIAIGSRSLPDSRLEKRQPWYRELMGKSFNQGLQWLKLTRFGDTQCGFKLFTNEAARAVCQYLRIDRFAYDVEILFVAESLRLPIAEVPVRWINHPESRVRIIRDSVRMLWEAACIWFNIRRGKYSRRSERHQERRADFDVTTSSRH